MERVTEVTVTGPATLPIVGRSYMVFSRTLDDFKILRRGLNANYAK
jgi:hypothetical protein